jgi:hypothetical protein
MSTNQQTVPSRSGRRRARRRSALSEARSIHDLEAGLRDGKWIGETGAGQVGVDIDAVRNARRARRSRRLAAARGQLRKFRGGAR